MSYVPGGGGYATPGYGFDPPPQPPQRRSNAWWIILLVVGGLCALPLGVVALIVVAALVFQGTAEEQPITDADRGVVITADALAEYHGGFEPDPAAETLTKVRYFDDSYEIDYEYEHPDETSPLGEGTGIYITTTVAVERNLSDARTVYVSQKAGLGIGLGVAGGQVTQQPRDDLLQWGDESHSTLLVNGGLPVGNFFIARKGTKVFCFMAVGVYFDDAESYEELVVPYLERLETYEP